MAIETTSRKLDNSTHRTTSLLLALFVTATAAIAILAADSYAAIGESGPKRPASSARQSASPSDSAKVLQGLGVGLEDRVRELENSQRAIYAAWLEGQRKTIDWWLSLLGMLAAVLAVAGGLIPYLLARKDKEVIELTLRQSRDAAERMQVYLRATEVQAQQATDHATLAKSRLEDIEKLKSAQAGQESPQQSQQSLQAAAESVRLDPEASPTDRLRAEAVQAQNEGATERAYQLWAAVSALEPSNALALFNSGFWAQKLAESGEHNARLFWQRQAVRHYARAFELQPDMHEIANNWGNALNAEAQLLVGTDLTQARALWKMAGETYAKALALKPNEEEAAYNWGVALLSEAKAIADTDLPGARTLWAQVGEKFAQALANMPRKHEAAYNWGNSLDLEARAIVKTDLSQALALWKEAREKYALALAIKPDKHEAANNWGNSLNAEARAMVESDVSGARALWKLAKEKYAQALAIKPDKYESLVNWAIVLRAEAKAIAESDIAAARILWQQAGEKCAQALAMQPEKPEAPRIWAGSLLNERLAVSKVDADAARACVAQARTLLLKVAQVSPETVAYDLACCFALEGRVSEALEWLRASEDGGRLPKKSYIALDSDFDAIRDTPEFEAWFNGLPE